MSKKSDSDTLEIEIDPNALKYLKEKGHVFILTDVENPRYSYYRIKGYGADLRIKFEEFVEICKANDESQTNPNVSQTEFKVGIFKVADPLKSMPSNLELYVSRSGFSTVKDWLKTLKKDQIPECTAGQKKTLYLYHVEKTF